MCAYSTLVYDSKDRKTEENYENISDKAKNALLFIYFNYLNVIVIINKRYEINYYYYYVLSGLASLLRDKSKDNEIENDYRSAASING